jgi:predicted Zn-dependent peptidase
MSLTQDGRKVWEAMLASLFPDYPYGTQTVLGTQEHLKNPSITNIKKYYNTWYVPNNIAICMSGDLNPDEVMDAITKYFGDMEPNNDIKRLEVPTTSPITAPITSEILGPDAENVSVGWRISKADIKDRDLISIVGSIVNNGKAGLFDVNLLQQQKVLSAFAGNYGLADIDMFIVQGRPKQGQTLDEVKELMIGEITKLKNGEFDEALLQGVINNYKYDEMAGLESNQSRANSFVESFIDGTPWQESVEQLDRMSKYTKEDIMAFANKYLGDNCSTIYKKQGKDPNEKKISKPQITPIFMNRDTASLFLKEVQANPGKPIEPVFLDFNKDLEQFKAQSDIPVLYKKNNTNDLFQLLYVFDRGSQHDKAFGTAANYLKYLGTSTKSLKEINDEFYQLACGFNVSTGLDRTYVTLYGLKENMPKAIELFEEILSDAQVDSVAYQNLALNILKKRKDAKLNQGQNFSQLINYAIWGENSPAKNILSEQELLEMNPQELVDKIHNLNNYEHRILYYGPDSKDELLATLKQYHKVPKKLLPIPESNVKFEYQPTTEEKVLIAPYDAKQIYYSAISNRGEKFDPAVNPKVEMYNEYFGGGMNAIVFQEMRESRGLAYSAGAYLITPSKLKYPYIYRTFIATQNDKMADALNAFDDIINNMPESENAYNLAKDALLNRLRTDRITKSDVLWAYLDAQELGLSEDSRKVLFEEIQKYTLDDIKKFQEEWVKGRKYTHCILGDEKELDLKSIEKYGPIIRLTQEDIFGY